MLTRLSIKHFRLLRDVSIDIRPGRPVVLVGPSSSGKSSVLAALELLSRFAQGGYEESLNSFGGSQALVSARRDASFATIEVSALREESDFPPPRTVELRYGLSFYRRSGAVAGEWLDYVDEGGESEALEVLRREPTQLRIWNEATHQSEIIATQPTQGISFDLLEHPELLTPLEQLRAELSSIQIHDGFVTTPSFARDARLSAFESTLVSPMPRLDRRGLQLVNTLCHIQNNDGDAWDELLDAFRAEFPFVKRLEFPADPAGGRISLGYRDARFTGVRLSSQQMSEGMISYLCLLAAVVSPAPRAALLLDEPQLSLGSAAMRRLVRLLEKASESTAVIVATRSPQIVDFLHEATNSVRVCELESDYVLVREIEERDLEAWHGVHEEPAPPPRADWPLIEVVEADEPSSQAHGPEGVDAPVSGITKSGTPSRATGTGGNGGGSPMGKGGGGGRRAGPRGPESEATRGLS